MKKLIICLLILLIVFIYSYSQNNWLQISEYDVYLKNLPSSFEEYTLVHLSDFHNKSFGENQKRLISKI